MDSFEMQNNKFGQLIILINQSNWFLVFSIIPSNNK